MNVSTLRDAVWHQLLDADRCARYYSALSDRYRKYHNSPRYITLIASVIGAGLSAASILDVDLEWLGLDWGTAGVFLFVFLVMGAVSTWDFVQDCGHKSAVLGGISSACAECETRLRHLWRELDDTDAPVDSEALNIKLKEIETEMDRVTARAGVVNVGIDGQLNIRVEEESDNLVSEKFSSVEQNQ